MPESLTLFADVHFEQANAFRADTAHSRAIIGPK
jgi:hypothetical protein